LQLIPTNLCLDPEIEIIEVDSDINSREFAKAVTDALRTAAAVTKNLA
jgi:hypothetical protein